MVDKYFEQAVKNIDYFMSKCQAGLLINECKYNNDLTARCDGAIPWYTFKLLDATIQEVTFEIVLPAIDTFDDNTVIYRDEFKWTVKKLGITDEMVISKLEERVEKHDDDRQEAEDWLVKYKKEIEEDKE